MFREYFSIYEYMQNKIKKYDFSFYIVKIEIKFRKIPRILEIRNWVSAPKIING